VCQRFPVKHTWDALSLLQILLRGDVADGHPLTLRKRLECIRFYIFADGTRRLYAATHRAGTKWIELGLALALDLAEGGDGEYEFAGDWYYPRSGLTTQRLDWRVPTGAWEAAHRRETGPTLGTRRYFATHIPYSKLRSAQVKNMRIVVITRSILASLESLFQKLAASSDHPEVRIDDESSFDWDRYLGEIIDFYNSWGDVMTWHPAIRHFRYEDLKAAPVDGHKEMLAFWGFDVPEECIAEGFRRASKKEMLKRMNPNSEEANIRVSVRGTEKRGIITDDRLRFIAARLDRDLVHDFGYDITKDRNYGIAYE
jgi:hypothetical protein